MMLWACYENISMQLSENWCSGNAEISVVKDWHFGEWVLLFNNCLISSPYFVEISNNSSSTTLSILQDAQGETEHNLARLRDNEWKENRRVLNPSFTTKKLKSVGCPWMKRADDKRQLWNSFLFLRFNNMQVLTIHMISACSYDEQGGGCANGNFGWKMHK